MLIGVVLAALAALLRSRTAVRASGPPGRSPWWPSSSPSCPTAPTWAGPATLVYGIALLAAAALGADGARARVAEQSFGWRQPVAALIAFAAAAGPLLVAAGWMIGGADGPLERRDPVQVPAFVAEESGTRDQARTLVLDSDSAAHVGYMLVRGSGARLGDAELAAADGEERAARQGRRQPRRRLRRRPGRRTRRLRRALRPRPPGRAPRGQPRPGRHARPEPAQPAGRQRAVAGRPAGLARAPSSPASGSGDPQPVAAGPVDIHTTIPAGADGRVLRLADTADDGWTATLDGKPLTPHHGRRLGPGLRTARLRRQAGRHLRRPVGHTAWLWAQGSSPSSSSSWPCRAAAATSTTTSPRSRAVPAQAVDRRGPPRPPPARPGGGRGRTSPARTRRPCPSSSGGGPGRRRPAAAVLRRLGDGEPRGAGAGHGQYDEQYQGAAAVPGRASSTRRTPDQAGQYDPYAVPGRPVPGRPVRPVRVPAGRHDPSYDQTYTQGYDPAYDPAQQHHGTGSERPDGSQQ